MKKLAAGVIIVREDGKTHQFLLLRAYSYWDFPKGLVEPGEDPIHAAIREVKEETTLTDLDFKWGYGFRETEPYWKGKVARYYLAETKQTAVALPISPELGFPEHEEYRWCSFREATELLHERVLPALRWAEAEVSLGKGDKT